MLTTKNKITKDQIIETISTMSVTDIVELISDIEKKFNVSASVVSPTSEFLNSSSSTDDSEEKTEFDVVLKSIGTNKIAVIKAVRSITGLGLKEAKDLVESAPTILKENMNKNDAETLKKSLEAAGAEIEIK